MVSKWEFLEVGYHSEQEISWKIVRQNREKSSMSRKVKTEDRDKNYI